MRTHRGTWDLFWTRLVDTGELPAALHTEATRAQTLRESLDYGRPAGELTRETAEATAAAAARFVWAVEQHLGAGTGHPPPR